MRVINNFNRVFNIYERKSNMLDLLCPELITFLTLGAVFIAFVGWGEEILEWAACIFALIKKRLADKHELPPVTLDRHIDSMTPKEKDGRYK